MDREAFHEIRSCHREERIATRRGGFEGLPSLLGRLYTPMDGNKSIKGSRREEQGREGTKK